jgi:AbrB family looped-hinge helix DNA binding protein
MVLAEEATMTSKGQITVPKRIREKLGLEAGKKVRFILRGGEIVMIPRSDSPLEDLHRMSEEVRFGQDEIRSMIQESKRRWSKFQ